jgi:hypothetical protein
VVGCGFRSPGPVQFSHVSSVAASADGSLWVLSSGFDGSRLPGFCNKGRGTGLRERGLSWVGGLDERRAPGCSRGGAAFSGECNNLTGW